MLILASGEKVRHVTFRPWMALAGVSLAALITTGYIGSAAYLFFRDDLFNATLARQARMQSDYEERIAALRVQVDNLTSRQYRDQQLVENSVARILDKQKELAAREEQIGAVLQKADSLQSASLSEDGEIDPVITHSFAPAPPSKASLGSSDPFEKLLNSPSTPLQSNDAKNSNFKTPGLAEKAEAILDHVDDSLNALEAEQKLRIAELTEEAKRKAEALDLALTSTGLRPASDSTSGMGGPYFEPLPQNMPFETHLDHLDQSIAQYNQLKATAVSLPLGLPAIGKRITSRFGNRIDPFLGRLALHAGIDFAARTGDDVLSTGAGKVVFAGTSGGYGKMVEIEHQNGYSTRFGHLSRISVSAGDEIDIGEIIGRAGSTGRSTGPHIHYEVRYNDRATDPIRFINAGKKITSLIQ